MLGQMYVERIDDMVVARVRGEPTADLLRACQDEVARLLGGETSGKVLYDTLDMSPPSVEVPWAQRALDDGAADIHWRRAVVVPSSRLAFLARLAFGEGNYRVFYDDIAAALRWLHGDAVT